MFNKNTIKKHELIDIIKSSKTMEEAASILKIDRKGLYNLRVNFEILHVQANALNYNYNTDYDIGRALNEDSEEVVIRYKGSYKENDEQEISLNQDKKAYTIEDIKNLSKKEAKELLNLIKNKTEEEDPENENLKEIYKGKFKEKSDITHKEFNKFVITSIQNDTNIDHKFLKSLINYCKRNNAKLLVTPVYYKFTSTSKFNIDDSLLFTDNAQLSNDLKLLTKLKVLPTIVDPFAGLDSLSKGDTIIIPHPQVAMKTMATLGDKPAQMWTTGSLSNAKGIYDKTKTGSKAEFNHSKGALVVELGNNDSFHIRNLNCDDNSGFYDIDGYYKEDTFNKLETIEAIYLGDTHVTVADDKVIKATFLNNDSIVKLLKPKTIIHGDLFDAQSVSHHDNHDYLIRVGKSLIGRNSVEKELNEVGDFILNTTPKNTKILINASNHNDHLYKWLTTTNPHNDLINAKMYHKLNYLMLDNLENSKAGPKYPNLLELWLKNSSYSEILDFTEFLGRKNGYKIKNIEISMHGDKGPNGAKGSPNSFSRLPTKSIVGHSHSPSINKGCYTVGTSSMKHLSYTGGPSSWMHTHCIIYNNGKRQLITIINGKWKM